MDAVFQVVEIKHTLIVRYRDHCRIQGAFHIVGSSSPLFPHNYLFSLVGLVPGKKKKKKKSIPCRPLDPDLAVYCAIYGVPHSKLPIQGVYSKEPGLSEELTGHAPRTSGFPSHSLSPSLTLSLVFIQSQFRIHSIAPPHVYPSPGSFPHENRRDLREISSGRICGRRSSQALILLSRVDLGLVDIH